MKRLLAAALLLAAGARAQADDARFGLQLDLGVPVGVALAAVAQPFDVLRLDAGFGYDLIAFGLKGGVTLAPFRWAVSPTLGVEAGHYFAGDASRFASGSSAATRILLSSVGYDYVSADVGLEVGPRSRYLFYLRAGIAQLFGSVKNVDAAFKQATVADASASARLPAVRLGLVYLF